MENEDNTSRDGVQREVRPPDALGADVAPAGAPAASDASPVPGAEGAPAAPGAAPTPAFQVVLASGSPRRRQLLQDAGIAFTVRVPDVDETLEPDLMADPPEAAKKLVLPSRSGKLEGFTEDEAATAVDECRGELIRLAFDGTTTDRPVIADMILSCGAPVSIVYADTRSIEGKLYGHTVLQLPSDAAVADKMKRWLRDQGISYTKEVQ